MSLLNRSLDRIAIYIEVTMLYSALSVCFLLQSPVPRYVIEFGMFAKQKRVEVYPIMLNLQCYDKAMVEYDKSMVEYDKCFADIYDLEQPPQPPPPFTYKSAFSREALIGTM